MRYWLAVAVAIALVVGYAGVGIAADTPPAATPIAIINNSTVVSNKALTNDLPYFQEAVDQMCSHWGCHLQLIQGTPTSAGEWFMNLDDSIQGMPGVLGYHTENAGTPNGVVAVKDSIQAGEYWGVTFTHEIDEMALDPEASAADNTDCASTDPATQEPADCTFYARELADPVQSYHYTLGLIHASDFVLPAWFEKDAPGPYDALRHLGSPLSLGTRAYLLRYTGGKWTQINTFSKAQRNWDTFFPQPASR